MAAQVDSDEGSIGTWIEQFEERAKMMIGWNYKNWEGKLSSEVDSKNLIVS